MQENEQHTDLWLEDRINPYRTHKHRIRKWIVRTKSEYQDIAVADSYAWGRCLVIDDDPQSCDSDEFIYHEALVHPAMLMHGSAQKVLILGGAEGATAREVLRHKSVVKLTVVDIDKMVVDLCKEYLPSMSAGAFEDERTELVIGDAREFIGRTTEVYDVIISDLSSPIEGGPAYLLYTSEFYEVLKRKLAPRGVFATQADDMGVVPFLAPTAIHRTLATAFAATTMYTCYVPSFVATWGFVLASDHPQLLGVSSTEVDDRIRRLIVGELKFYDGETHEGMFSLPKHLRHAIATQDVVITEAAPVFKYR